MGEPWININLNVRGGEAVGHRLGICEWGSRDGPSRCNRISEFNHASRDSPCHYMLFTYGTQIRRALPNSAFSCDPCACSQGVQYWILIAVINRNCCSYFFLKKKSLKSLIIMMFDLYNFREIVEQWGLLLNLISGLMMLWKERRWVTFSDLHGEDLKFHPTVYLL